MSDKIQAIVMPKWGLAMTEGKLAEWLVQDGASIAKGQDLAEIETTKITNVFESPTNGILRRRVVQASETVPVGALLAVVADPSVSDADIQAFADSYVVAAPEEGDAAVAAPEPEYATIGSGRLRFLRLGQGEGTPVVLLHGFGADLNNWMFNQSALAEKATVYALDLPGHGGSYKDLGDGSVAAFSKAVSEFLKERGVARAHLVGHSLGGAIALDLALRDPKAVASLTLIAPGALGSEINGEFITGFIEAGKRKQLQPILEMLVHNPELVSRDMIEEVLKFKRLDGVEQGLKAIAATTFAGGKQALDLSSKLASLTVPMQIIWGKDDRVIPVDHAGRAPASAKVHRLDATGHMPHMEKSNEINGFILDFIAGKQ